MSLRHYIALIAYVCFLYVLFPRDAYAYLDPGSGSYIFQLIIAAFVGAGFMLKMYSKKVKAFLSGLFSDSDE